MPKKRQTATIIIMRGHPAVRPTNSAIWCEPRTMAFSDAGHSRFVRTSLFRPSAFIFAMTDIRVSCRRTFALLFASLLGVVHAQTITKTPENQTAGSGGSVTFTVAATGSELTYQWRKNGTPLVGATSAALTVSNIQPQNAGIYTAVVSSGASSTSASAILGFTAIAKVTGAGTEVGADIPHPTGNTYDQVLLQGPVAAVTADPGQVTRISYIDLNDDIVQVEFAGPGTLTLQLDNNSGPAAPLKYNQDVLYMKGHANIVIAGADETTNVSVFSVGRANAVNQALFRNDVSYDGIADIASVAIVGGNGKFGGLRSANASYFATKGFTGVYASGIQFGGPVFVGDIDAFDAATPVFLVGSASDVRITGGDLLQTNMRPVQVAGLSQLSFVNGSTSHGKIFPYLANKGVLQQNGVDVTAQLAPRPSAALYLAQLRPSSGATSSTASGYATILINADGSATVNATFSNLSSAQTAAHLALGNSSTYVLTLPFGQVSNRVWNFAPSATYTTNDLINALNQGNIFVALDTANFPSGELVGNFVLATGSKSFTPPAAPPALSPGALSSPTQTDAARLLTQATYGPTTATIAAVQARGINGWIDDQMALPATGALAALRADLAAFPNPFREGEPFAIGHNRNPVWFKMSVTGPDQLRQRVAFALSEIFVVSQNDEVGSEARMRYYDILLGNAFGNFRQLLDDVTLSPMMGSALSYAANAKADPTRGTAPDENFAREVMQLFTIGLVQLQPDGTLLLDSIGQPIPTYNQEMVSEMAKVFTGWAWATGAATTTDVTTYIKTRPSGSSPGVGLKDDSGWLAPMRYFDAFHDKTVKRIVGVQQVAPAAAVATVLPANQLGPQDLKAALDTLFAHPNTGPFFCRQLIQRLVTSNPSPAYVYRVAQVFTDDGTGTRGNLGAVVRAILTDYEARSPGVLGNAGYGKIKEPLIRLTSLLRALNAAAPNGRFMDSWFGDPKGSQGYWPTGPLAVTVGYYGQAALEAPTVFNFFSPTYSPPGPMAAAGLVAPELEIMPAFFAIKIPNNLTKFLYRDTSTFAQPPTGLSPYLEMDYSAYLPNAKNPTALSDQLNLIFCAGQMSPATRNEIAKMLQAVPANASDVDRVRAAIFTIIVSPDGALQK